jgi:ferric iron reductase protein FhuF
LIVPPGAAESVSGDLPARLDRFVAERWPFLAGRIFSAAAPSSGRRHLVELGDGDGLRGCLERFARDHPGQDPRGIASLWVQWHAVSVCPGLIVAALILRQRPAGAGPDMAAGFDDAGCPTGLCIPGAARRLDAECALGMLLCACTRPIVEVATEHAAMAPRVAWSNVANVTGWMLAELRACVDAACLAPGYRLLRLRRFRDGSSNPLFTDTRVVAATGRPARRTCCLRYRLDEHPYCSDCPIPANARKA